MFICTKCQQVQEAAVTVIQQITYEVNIIAISFMDDIHIFIGSCCAVFTYDIYGWYLANNKQIWRDCVSDVTV